MKKQEHTLWKEKYRSKTLDEYVGNEKIKKDFAKFIANNDFNDLLLTGRPGTGKTTLAKLLYNTMDCDYIYINASDENGIETIREKVKQFAMTASFKPLKLIVLDEADFLTKEAQAALRNIMETYSLKTRFILTANYLPKIIEALQSRCEIYQITPPSKGEVAQHIAENILDKEKIKYDIKDVAKVINIWYPDIRKTISTLNTLVEGNKLVVDDKSLVQSSYFLQILNEFKKPNKKSWETIRQIILDAQVDDYQPLYRFLFDNLNEFAPEGKQAEIIIMLDEYSWRAMVVMDREINCAALINQILLTLGV